MEFFKKHKILSLILAFIVIAVITSAAGGGSKTSDSANGGNSRSSSNEKTYKFNDRADKQPKDVEVLPGEAAVVGGVKLKVSGVEYKTLLNEYETAESGKHYVVADVVLENTSNETQPYNVFDFRIQTTSGQVLDGAFTTLPTLGSGDMVAGGRATGKVVFEVPIETGHQWIIWKPNGFNADRAIVQVR